MALVTVSAALIHGGCATGTIADAGDSGATEAPAVVVTAADPFSAAMADVRHREGDFVVVGIGESMAPLFLPGTALVVHPTSYFMLRRGMSVVYQNRHGYHVAHLLLARAEKGWVVAGLNNQGPDDELLTPDNLVGVVKIAFVPDAARRLGRIEVESPEGGKNVTANLLH